MWLLLHRFGLDVAALPQVLTVMWLLLYKFRCDWLPQTDLAVIWLPSTSFDCDVAVSPQVSVLELHWSTVSAGGADSHTDRHTDRQTDTRSHYSARNSGQLLQLMSLSLDGTILQWRVDARGGGGEGSRAGWREGGGGSVAKSSQLYSQVDARQTPVDLSAVLRSAGVAPGTGQGPLERQGDLGRQRWCGMALGPQVRHGP